MYWIDAPTFCGVIMSEKIAYAFASIFALWPHRVRRAVPDGAKRTVGPLDLN